LAESPNTITQNNERGDNKHFNVNDLIKEKGIERQDSQSSKSKSAARFKTQREGKGAPPGTAPEGYNTQRARMKQILA
jgi:hypothetical protein